MALITVELKNPPAEATDWQLSITDWNANFAPLHYGLNLQDNIGQVASFEVPDNWAVPYRIVALQVSYPTPGDPSSQTVLYYMQSWRPLLWDWDLWDWSTDPDPTYRDAFIPGPGDYFYNIATEQFETVPPELPPFTVTVDAPDSAAEGSSVPVSAAVTNHDPFGYEVRTQVWVGSTLIETFQEVINPGQSKTYQAVFTMPGYDTSILVWVEINLNAVWQFRGAAAKDITLSVAPPPVEFRNFALAEYNRV